MKINDLAFIAIRVFLLYLLYQLIINAFRTAAFIGLDGDAPVGSVLPSVVIFVVGFALFAFFWARSAWLAKLAAGDRGETVLQTGLSVDDIQSAAFAAAGIFVLAMAVPATLHTALQHYLDIRSPAYGPSGYGGQYAYHAAQLLFGISLIFGAGWLTKLIRKFRRW